MGRADLVRGYCGVLFGPGGGFRLDDRNDRLLQQVAVQLDVPGVIRGGAAIVISGGQPLYSNTAIAAPQSSTRISSTYVPSRARASMRRYQCCSMTT